METALNSLTLYIIPNVLKMVKQVQNLVAFAARFLVCI